MLVRDADGKLNIISRKKCKNETDYNEKLYKIRYLYMTKYKSVFLNPPKVQTTCILKNLSDD
jgi:hypothetical protein